MEGKEKGENDRKATMVGELEEGELEEGRRVRRKEGKRGES